MMAKLRDILNNSRHINLIPIVLLITVLVLQLCCERSGIIYIGSSMLFPQHILNDIVLGILLVLFVVDGLVRKEWLFYITYSLATIHMINNAFDGFSGYYDYNNILNVAIPRAIYYVSIVTIAALLLIVSLHIVKIVKKKKP